MFQFDSLADFMAMAGHGPYVWISYAVSLAVMLYLVVSPLLRRRTTLRAVRLEEARSRGRRSRQDSAPSN